MRKLVFAHVENRILDKDSLCCWVDDNFQAFTITFHLIQCRLGKVVIFMLIELIVCRFHEDY